MDWEHPSWRLDLAFISKPLHIDMERSNKIILACVFHGPCPSDGWTSNNQRAGRGRQSNLTSCLFHQILSNFLPSLSIRWLDQQQSARRTRPAEQLDIMPFPSDSVKFLAFLVHQMTGPATISAPDEAGRATWHHAFSIRFSQISCLPCPSDDWTSNNHRAGRGRQSNLTSCLFHQILSNFLPSLSIRWLDQQQSPRRTRPAEQLDIMPFPSDSLKFLAFLVHQMTGPATISAPDEASRATWHHAFSIRFSQITCLPCPSDDWTSNNQRTGRGPQSNLTSCLFHQILSNHLLSCPSDGWTTTDRSGRGQQSNLTSCLFHKILSNYLPSLSIRWLDQQQSARRTRLAEQLDIMPFP